MSLIDTFYADAAKGAKAAAKPKAKKPKEGTKAWGRWHAAAVQRRVRWGVQLVFLLLSPSLFSAAFNGVKYLFQQIGAGEAIEANSFVAILVTLLLFTIIFGRFFCGYACSFGLLGDAVFAAFAPVRRKLGIPEKLLTPAGQRVNQMVKYVLLALICVLCFTGRWSSVSGASPWVAFAGFVGLSLGNIAAVSFVLLAVIVVGMALQERFFCQFLCPMGAVFSLMPVLPWGSYARKRERCAKKCDRCELGCPVSIHPDPDEWYGGECIACGRCVTTCPLSNISLVDVERRAAGAAEAAGSSGAAAYTAAVRGAAKRGDAKADASKKPAAKKADASNRFVLRGNETWLVLAKAALLLVACWLLGMVEFLPKPPDGLVSALLPWLS